MIKSAFTGRISIRDSSLVSNLTRIVSPVASGHALRLLHNLEVHHPATAWHCVRVSLLSTQAAFNYAALFRRKLDLRGLLLGSLLHDIGKITIPRTILDKVEPLSEEEWRTLRTHPATGWAIVQQSGCLREARSCVLQHHERWDGNGYPCRIPKHRIPKEARIVSVADAFDAMTSKDRQYRVPFTIEDARTALKSGAGVQFDPQSVKAFDLIPEVFLETVLTVGVPI